MKKLLIATTNHAKFEEITRFLSDLSLEYLSLSSCGIKESIEETGNTIEENSRIKALFYGNKVQLPTISDDGALEIDYLDGKPGVYSRRWEKGGKELSDKELIDKTLSSLSGIPNTKRGAQLRAVITFYNPLTGFIIQKNARIRGIIAKKPYSHYWKGFPYRSLFYISEIGKYYNPNDLTHYEEEQYNHRKKALEQLKPYLKLL